MLTPVVEAAEQAEEERTHAGTTWQWLILSAYLLGAVVLTWGLWADPASRVQVRDQGDGDQFVWFLRYSATAISHWRLPALLTTAMDAPQGFNLMWNTHGLLLGSLLTPVTLLAGPQVSDTLILTLGFAGSAACMFLVLRRWGASISGAGLGGAMYGFSPYLVYSGVHLQLAFALLPPLIIDAMLRIVTGRGALRTGVWLGLLIAAQFFIGEELLLFTGIAGGLLTLLMAITWPRPAIDRAAAAVPGLATATGVALLLCGRALWVQFQDRVLAGSHAVATRTGAVLLDSTANGTARPAAPRHEPLAYLRGDHPISLLHELRWPLLIALIAVAILFWRNPKVRIAAVMFAGLDLLALGGVSQSVAGLHYPGYLHPWFWLARLPVLSSALPGRMAILADGAAGALLAFSLDHARSLVPADKSWRNAGPAMTAAAILLILPIVPRPYPVTNAAPVPAGWQAAFARLQLPADARVLVAPFPYGLIPQPLRWQADTGEPATMIGGDYIGFNQDGQRVRAGRTGDWDVTAKYIDELWTGSPQLVVPSPAQISADIAFWRPAAVVAVTRPQSPLGRFLIGEFGPPTYQIGSLLAWRLQPAGNSGTASATQPSAAHLGAGPGGQHHLIRAAPPDPGRAA